MLTNPAHPRCPICDYDLHGLHGPRCPECGTTVDLDALRRLKRTAVDRHALRVVFMVGAVVLAMPVAMSIIAFVREVARRESIDFALAAMPDAADVTFLALPHWRPSAVLMSVAVAAAVALFAVALFAAALTSWRRWYLALLGALMVDAAWIVSIWCGIQVVMNI